jgi:hypothetical protein
MIFFRISTTAYPMACSGDILKEFGHCFHNNGVLWLLIICLMMFLCHPQLMASDILIFTCVLVTRPWKCPSPTMMDVRAEDIQ